MNIKSSRGFTLIEALITTAILGVVSLSLVAMLGHFGTSVSMGRTLTLATHLSQEQVEYVKSQSFYAVNVTSSAVYDSNYSPPLEYDGSYYPPQTIKSGGTTFVRRTFVEKTDTPTGQIVNMGYPHPDTGLKRVTVHTCWQDSNGIWKKVTVSSLVSNPNREALDKRVFGYVTDQGTGDPVGGVLVQARRNPGWGSYTDNTGYYSFQATDATMKLVGNRYAYQQHTSPKFNINYGDNQYDFQMVQITSVPVTGYVLGDAGLVISQVNNKWHATNDSEYIELYNGSTTTIDLSAYSIIFVDKFDVENNISPTLVDTTIPGHSYYLIYGSQFGGVGTAPDGTVANATFTALMNHGQQGGVIIRDGSGNDIDRVAWGQSTFPNEPPAAAVEGTGVIFSGSPGIGQGYTLFRKALSSSTDTDLFPPSGAHVNSGNAWDTNNNTNDFVLLSTASPRNTSDSAVPMGGKALEGAVVSADDAVSTSTQAVADGSYELYMDVGTYTITAASGAWMAEKVIVVTSGGPNEHILIATTPATVGYVYGDIRKYCSETSKFPGIIVRAEPGGYETTSDGSANYFMALPADEEYYLNGNPDFANPDWNNAVTPDAIYINPGQVHGPYPLCIWKNSYASGRVTTNGVDGLPGVTIVASGKFSNGNSAVTDAAGYYVIPGLRLIGNPYNISPVLLPGQSTSPGSYSKSMSQGNNYTGLDFVITNAYVNISGTALLDGQPIESGVTVLVSTTSINSASPPDITFSMRREGTSYYQTLTDASGNYSVPVINNETYNLVAWYTNDQGSTTYKTANITVNSNSGSSGNNLSWP